MKPIPVIVGVLCALCTLFAAALVEQRLAPTTTNWGPIGPTFYPTNSIDLSKDTNWAFLLEAPKPSKVTIWFMVQSGNEFEWGPVINASIETNLWPVTASNALVMVKERLKGQEKRLRFESTQLTGIWRDE